MRNLSRAGGKTDKRGFGPYTIVKIHDKELYSLKNKSDGKVLARRVHGNRLTTFHEHPTHDIIGIEDTSLLENDANEVKLSRMNAMLLRRLVHNLVPEMRVLMMKGILVWWCPKAAVQMEVSTYM